MQSKVACSELIPSSKQMFPPKDWILFNIDVPFLYRIKAPSLIADPEADTFAEK